MAGWAKDAADGVVIELLIQPRASRTRAVGEHDGRLKIQLAAPPVDGEANGALLEFLAGVFRVRKGDVRILRGETGRRKSVHVQGVTAATALHLLTQFD